MNAWHSEGTKMLLISQVIFTAFGWEACVLTQSEDLPDTVSGWIESKAGKWIVTLCMTAVTVKYNTGDGHLLLNMTALTLQWKSVTPVHKQMFTLIS